MTEQQATNPASAKASICAAIHFLQRHSGHAQDTLWQGNAAKFDRNGKPLSPARSLGQGRNVSLWHQA